jgi:hypothetical protein
MISYTMLSVFPLYWQKLPLSAIKSHNTEPSMKGGNSFRAAVTYASKSEHAFAPFSFHLPVWAPAGIYSFTMMIQNN